MHVVATAGHVDHGKSTLVRALTGMEPDRWSEERRRGLTIDLGYAWTHLPSGTELAFVDVPGHQRFIGNMLAGLGPAPAVLFVVAADEGWGRQSAEHLAAVDALDVRHGVLAVTRCDLADPGAALAAAAEEVGRSTLGDIPRVTVSGSSGQGLDALRGALDDVVARLPEPDRSGRVRLWIDRAFTIRGSGTVVTGTLGAGTVRVGDELELRGDPVRVRGLECLARSVDVVPAVARVAINLRSVGVGHVRRGDVLLTPGAWHATTHIDARLSHPGGPRLPAELVMHIGTAAVPVRLRPMDDQHVRLTLSRPLPLEAGDRAILRDPGRQAIVSGLLVLDVAPPALKRRGAARRRAAALAETGERPDPVAEVARRGAVRAGELQALGVPVGAIVGGATNGRHGAEAVETTGGVEVVDGWLVAPRTWRAWVERLPEVVERHAASSPLQPALPLEVARRALDVPDVALVHRIAAAAGLVEHGGTLRAPGTRIDLGPAEPAVQLLEARLGETPFVAPDRDELRELGLGPRELAAAERCGRLTRIAPDIVLAPSAPRTAAALLAELPQPFTVSEARRHLSTTRRVAVPLLEHLDTVRLTRRVDANHREVLRDHGATIVRPDGGSGPHYGE